MRIEVAQDLKDSSYDFLRIWPLIALRYGGGDFITVEAATTEGLTKNLDVLAGIDGFQTNRARGFMRAIASRVQWMDSDRSYESHTIRLERLNGAMTEYEKRVRAIERSEEGYLYPPLTVQAYLTPPPREGWLLSVGAVKTEPLYRVAQNIMAALARGERSLDWGIRTNSEDGVRFLFIKWTYLRALGIEVKTWVRKVSRRAA